MGQTNPASRASRRTGRAVLISLLVAATLALGIGVSLAAGAVAHGSHAASSRQNVALANPSVPNAPVPGRAVPAAATSKLRAVALLLARGNGEPRLPVIRAVVSTRPAAVGLITPGDTVPGANHPVYVIVMTGKFVGYLAKTPSSTKPTGTTLAATIDPANFQILDWSLTNLPLASEISKLGPVSQFR